MSQKELTVLMSTNSAIRKFALSSDPCSSAHWSPVCYFSFSHWDEILKRQKRGFQHSCLLYRTLSREVISLLLLLMIVKEPIESWNNAKEQILALSQLLTRRV